MNAKTKISIAIVVSVIGFILAVALGMSAAFEPPAAYKDASQLVLP
ncbi:MAG: hypothetical protein OXF62_11415 [Caldilineaceae bacterium]|nr:hypothetical protein [Caldilineaceae bacterium]